MRNLCSSLSDLQVQIITAIKNGNREEGLNGIQAAFARLKVLDEHEHKPEGVAKFINHQDENGDTLLHHAARAGNVAAIELLCSVGADPNIKNNANETAWNVVKPTNKESLDSLQVWQKVGIFLQQQRIDFEKIEKSSKLSILQTPVNNLCQFINTGLFESIHCLLLDCSRDNRFLEEKKLLHDIAWNKENLGEYTAADVQKAKTFLRQQLADDYLFCDEKNPRSSIQVVLGTLYILCEELEKEIISKKDAFSDVIDHICEEVLKPEGESLIDSGAGGSDAKRQKLLDGSVVACTGRLR